jgi:hypothetical protein
VDVLVQVTPTQPRLTEGPVEVSHNVYLHQACCLDTKPEVAKAIMTMPAGRTNRLQPR